jgi:hypothetical protein
MLLGPEEVNPQEARRVRQCWITPLGGDDDEASIARRSASVEAAVKSQKPANLPN